MATMAHAARDFPTTSGGRETFAGLAARSVPVTRTHPTPLPTPPNSISPALPPHGLKAQLQKARLAPIDSDLDLQDGQEDHHAGHTGALGSPPYDLSGVISSAMLAKFHLPEILLNHGPLAIRHVMGYLTTSVPGFANIPPAKARRLVVGALEGRGSGGEGGGLDGDVEFEKVGWGRWDARRRGQPPRDSATATRRDVSPTSGGLHAAGIPISRSGGWTGDRLRPNGFGASAADVESALAFSHDDGCDMLENEADKMSMDGSASASCSEAPDEDMAMNDDPEDVTDDEDWAAVGAAALRARSYQAQSVMASHMSQNVHTSGGAAGPSGNSMCAFSASNAGMRRAPYVGGSGNNYTRNNFEFSTSAFGATSDAQEREAVAIALLRLGGSV